MNLPRFSFRFLLAAVAVCATVSPAASAQPACTYERVARLPLSYSGPGLQITTPGTINGKPATMLVDTGAYTTTLTGSGAQRHGLKLRNTNTEAYGIGGATWIYQARVDRFSLGPVTAGKSYMNVLGDTGSGTSIDALVGAPFLLQSDLEISLATKELNFFRPSNCSDKFLGYWDPGAVVIPFIPGSSSTANPHFPVRINGIEVDAMIDSGASVTVLALPAARRAGVKIDEARRLADVAGVGSQRRAQWSAVLDRIEIGTESVDHAEVSVVDHDVADLILGADFLRSHRVLFAMSQHKIYFSYIGGSPFGQRHKLEPWIVAEAEAGNPDAQFALANAYLAGKRVPRSEAQSRVWLERAAASGNPRAQVRIGRALMLNGKMAEAAGYLRAGLDKLPAQPEAALWLHIARLHGGQAALAKSELAAAFAQAANDWRYPVAQFYLGQIDAGTMLERAARDKRDAAAATCFAYTALAEWRQARGEGDEAGAEGRRYRAACPAAAQQAE